jgi:cytochrome c oxidase cbb3-type subunit 2
MILSAAAIGAATGLLTVTLATGLRTLLGTARFGLAVGAGTGLAYLVCNLPPLFEGSPATQSWTAAAVCLAAAGLAARGSHRSATALQPTPVASAPAVAGRSGGPLAWAPHEAQLRPFGFATLLLSFLALVWLDSAAFAVIQETLALKGLTWAGGGRQLTLGTVHLLAALAAGWAIDRGRLRSLLLIAGGLFAVAFGLLFDPQLASRIAGPIYAVGISLYSVALVAYPARHGDAPGRVAVRWRAALLFGIAGWIGSALGVGMAQDLHTVPAPFVWTVMAVLLASALLSQAGRGAAGWGVAGRGVAGRGPRLRGVLTSLLRAHRWTFLAAVIAAVLYGWVAPLGIAQAGQVREEPAGRPPNLGSSAAIARGREVYIAEGCIHCHSQYVRPAGRDVELWGPHRPFDRAQRPMLLGNRRQGPDLATAGARRSAAWHRLHLLAPRALSPASRMPSYAHLFADGSGRGDDLVAYLASLGADDARARYELAQALPMEGVAEQLATASPARGAALFARHCAACHGPRAQGDGPLAPSVSTPAMNLTKPAFVLVSWGPGAEPLELGLARAVRFGIANTSMAGHETLSDAEVADLVAFVRALPREAAS